MKCHFQFHQLRPELLTLTYRLQLLFVGSKTRGGLQVAGFDDGVCVVDVVGCVAELAVLDC